MENDARSRMGTEKIPKLLMSFSLPAIGGMLVNALYNIVDRIFIGNSLETGELGLAAISFAFPVMMIMMALALLFATGGATLFSISLGEKNREKAEQILGNSAALLLISGVSVTVLGLIFLEPILRVCGAGDLAMEYSKQYLSIILWGSVFQSISMGGNHFLRADGHPKLAMSTMLIGVGINIILAPIFIYGLHMGMHGAGLATIIGQAVSAAWVLIHFTRAKGHFRVRWSNLRINARRTGRIVVIGLPAFSIQIAGSLMTVALNNSLMYYGARSEYGGDNAVSAFGIITALQNLLILPLVGVTHGAAPILGYNRGAGQYGRVKQTWKISVLAATAFCIIIFGVIQIWASPICALFNQTPILVELSAKALRVDFIFLPIIGFQVVSSSFFQATGEPYKAITLTLLRQIIVFIPLVLILPLTFGFWGVIYAAPGADIAAGMITAAFIIFEFRKDRYKNYVKEAV